MGYEYKKRKIKKNIIKMPNYKGEDRLEKLEKLKDIL